MAYAHYTATGPYSAAKDRVRKVVVTVNAALTGTITLADETATAGSPAIAVITNPTVGSRFEYYDLKNGLSVNPSTTCDITVNTSSGQVGW